MPSIVIGAKESGSNVADHASSIDTLIEVDKNGNTRKISFKPESSNPGQETMQFIEGHFSDTEAFVIGLMRGPPNQKTKIIQESNKSVKDIIEQYKKSYSEESSTKDNEEEIKYNVPKQDGSGKGTRSNRGRNPECEPGDYEKIGQGSGTRSGRAAEASPQKKAYDTTQSTIDNLVVKYSNAKTDEQKEIVAQAIGQYLKEAADKNLTGIEAEKYVAKRLEEKGYSKNKSDSQKSSKKANNKGTAKKAA